MPLRATPTAGFSLLELLLVVAVVGILLAIVLPSTQPSIYDQLRSTARIVATDLAYARSLAVAYNSTYRVTFDTKENQYILKHSGTNAALNKLPPSPFASRNDLPEQHIVDLDDLPHVGATVRLIAAAASGAALQRVDNVEFGPLGQTTRSDPTMIWLTAGIGGDQRYIALQVNPVTGLTPVGAFDRVGPPASLSQ